LKDPQLAIFLSPHFDDIALSCGGMATHLARRGARCIGLTVFSAPAPDDAPISDYMKDMHGKWVRASGGETATINELRREEERAVMRLLNLQPVWLDLHDAPYRRSAAGEHFYTSDEHLFGKVDMEERISLVPSITEEIRRVVRESGARGRVRVFAPLGVGHHVDHQLVFWAARRLGPRCGVLFYEDYPYAAMPSAVEARIAELGLPIEARLTPISELIGIKIAAISRYKSQLDVLFGSSADMPAAVRAYAHAVAATAPAVQYAERYWYIPPVYTLTY
jgi:LmbE family N-acetylglucosaminyl deacetylase